MSAPAYARNPAAPAEADRQPRLFALPGGAAALPLPEDRPQRAALAPVPSLDSAVPAAIESAAPVATLPGPARESRADRMLDAELRLAWTALAAGAPAACIMCGGRMEPRAGAAGGACTSCGTTLD